MRILALETSSQRGTVALVEFTGANAHVVGARDYDADKGHSTYAMRLVDELFRETGWDRGSVDRVAAGIGPGSFTGLRVGISVAQGIALALGKPALGVGSLRAMCRGVPPSMPGLRCAFGDARRGELFAAAYDGESARVAGIATIPRAELTTWIDSVREGKDVVLVGAVLGEFPELGGVHRSDITDRPSAVCVAELAARLDPALAPAEPEYVRGADAIRPNLPPHPLWSGEPK